MCELPLLKEQLEKQDARLNHLEQYSRRNCLLIHGVREEDGAQTEDECVAMALQIFNANMQIAVNGSSIDRAHRIGKKNPKKNRPIIVKFVSYYHRRLVFSQKSRLKSSGIYITESLTKENFKILNEAKQIYSMNNVWTNDGRILIKDGARIHTVTSSKELQNLSVQKMRNLTSDPSSPVLSAQQSSSVPTPTSNNSSFNLTNVMKPAPSSNIPVPVPSKPKNNSKAKPKKSPAAQKYNRNRRNK
ncbi:hypothetical protein WDU94_001934 [Cyamophila willieti]